MTIEERAKILDRLKLRPRRRVLAAAATELIDHIINIESNLKAMVDHDEKTALRVLPKTNIARVCKSCFIEKDYLDFQKRRPNKHGITKRENTCKECRAKK